jgi:[protein-PII] uridylyltransferase
MSQTAQRKDIYDPKIIADFCKLFPEKEYLDYLYLLTVADICGTNPTLWNAWRDSLLKELYFSAKQTMSRDNSALNESDVISLRKEQAMAKLISDGLVEQNVKALWETFKGKYFLHESPDIIATHTKAILTTQQFPLILIMPHHTQSGLEVFIYMPH